MRVAANTYSCSATRIRNFVHFFQGFEVPEIPKCMTPLGLQNGQIQNSAMTASSIACQPYFGRLWLHSGGGKTGGWCAGANDVNQWLQVDFGKFVEIRRISTQGRQEAAQWVTRYRLEFSYDGVFFEEYKSDGEVKVSESDITSIWISNGKVVLCRAFRENCTIGWSIFQCTSERTHTLRTIGFTPVPSNEVSQARKIDTVSFSLSYPFLFSVHLFSLRSSTEMTTGRPLSVIFWILQSSLDLSGFTQKLGTPIFPWERSFTAVQKVGRLLRLSTKYCSCNADEVRKHHAGLQRPKSSVLWQSYENGRICSNHNVCDTDPFCQVKKKHWACAREKLGYFGSGIC